jgi:hypothetical protein
VALAVLPSLLSPAQITVGTATQTDTTGLMSGMSFPEGTDNMEFTAIDGSGNSSVCSFDVIVNPIYTTIESATISQGERYLFGSQTLTAAGAYTELYQSMSGCDSLIDLTLTVNSVDVGASVASYTLTANAVGALYQWVDYNDNFEAIVGESGGRYSPLIDGSYAVVVTENGCIDTTACEDIIT